jgi:hypothetical protein
VQSSTSFSSEPRLPKRALVVGCAALSADCGWLLWCALYMPHLLMHSCLLCRLIDQCGFRVTQMSSTTGGHIASCPPGDRAQVRDRMCAGAAACVHKCLGVRGGFILFCVSVRYLSLLRHCNRSYRRHACRWALHVALDKLDKLHRLRRRHMCRGA